ncbi:MAG TPA: hypothetical protein VF163_21520 [Micromonosporaceae bacterium]
MALIVPSTITAAGLLANPQAVAASDTISGDQIPIGGVLIYRVINGGASPDNVAISDGGTTPAGNPGTVTPVAVANGTTRTFPITRNNVNRTTNLVTITHSFTTSVTYELQRV